MSTGPSSSPSSIRESSTSPTTSQTFQTTLSSPIFSRSNTGSQSSTTTSSPNPTSSSLSPPSTPSPLSSGEKAGIAVGSIAGFFFFALFIYLLLSHFNLIRPRRDTNKSINEPWNETQIVGNQTIFHDVAVPTYGGYVPPHELSSQGERRELAERERRELDGIPVCEVHGSR
ncbi:hypothetical protein B0J11DRAFT_584976 [Dendryphion nanum]|uniref:Uncharacterized protein n=1 Tax=Dendryphion nanum TaxID=256645 RepID=A0A9P9D714_9PLEO|nr:hypothetical protein B0J11DRAFT_584976 [Dendryphion nanum]